MSDDADLRARRLRAFSTILGAYRIVAATPPQVVLGVVEMLRADAKRYRYDAGRQELKRDQASDTASAHALERAADRIEKVVLLKPDGTLWIDPLDGEGAP
jgi:hypothetical protein